MSNLDYQKIINIYWPVIEAAIEVQKDYAGGKKIVRENGIEKEIEKPARIAPNSVGYLIETLIRARLKMPIKREIVEIKEEDEQCQQQ